MKAVSVELVPRDASSVVLGVTLARSLMSIAPLRSSAAPEKALTAIGTLTSVSSRRRAVTTMAALSSSLAAAGGGVSCARAGRAARPLQAAEASARVRMV